MIAGEYYIRYFSVSLPFAIKQDQIDRGHRNARFSQIDSVIKEFLGHGSFNLLSQAEYRRLLCIPMLPPLSFKYSQN
jgi:hypothetical protein